MTDITLKVISDRFNYKIFSTEYFDTDLSKYCEEIRIELYKLLSLLAIDPLRKVGEFDDLRFLVTVDNHDNYSRRIPLTGLRLNYYINRNDNSLILMGITDPTEGDLFYGDLLDTIDSRGFKDLIRLEPGTHDASLEGNSLIVNGIKYFYDIGLRGKFSGLIKWDGATIQLLL